MKQKLLKSLMLIAVLLTSNAVWAYDFESGGIYYNILSEEEKTVEVTYRDTDYNSYTGEVVIPSTVTNGETTYSVTGIGYMAVIACTDLTSITIPNSVTSIGDYAFQACPVLNSITIPEGLTSIGKCTFRGCCGLTNITIPNSVTSIGANAFFFLLRFD